MVHGKTGASGNIWSPEQGIDFFFFPHYLLEQAKVKTSDQFVIQDLSTKLKIQVTPY